MKLRFDKNSLRLRLKKSDVEVLQEHQSIQETIIFPNGAFSYRLSLAAEVTEIATCLQDQLVEVTVPFSMALDWMNGIETGLYHTIVLNHQHSLNIIIEKDFACKDRADEDASDSFTEPSTLNISKHC